MGWAVPFFTLAASPEVVGGSFILPESVVSLEVAPDFLQFAEQKPDGFVVGN